MKKIRTAFLRRFSALLPALTLVLSLTGAAFADDASESGIAMESGSAESYTVVTSRYYEPISGEMHDMPVNYSDGFFSRDPEVFYLDLAQASLGLAEASIRIEKEEGVALDTNVRSFLTEAGFDDFESVWYDRDPTEDSIATAIASKKLGDTTVIALVCPGAGYGMEWLSNLTVGSGTEHEGFSSAASQCEERLYAYIGEHGITGDIRLWLTGFSRAAAVGNLLAARLTERNAFAAVYGYFFATPNNTTEPVACGNIFNIIGQNDPVPQIPLACWGYGRSGVDLYTPAQESNSSYISQALLANVTAGEITGQSFRNNPDLNRQLHVVLEYLGEVFPTAREYAEILQPRLISAWKEHSGSDLLTVLQGVLADIHGLPAEQQSAADALAAYLDGVIYQYISGNSVQKQDGSWNGSDAISANVALEHQPAVYASWLFSTDDPSALFAGSTATMRLVMEGDFDLEVWDADGIVQTISSDGEEAVFVPGSDRPDTAPLIYLYAADHDGKAVINLPHDRDYILKLIPGSDETVSLFTCSYSYAGSGHSVSDLTVFSASAGERIVLSDFFSADGVRVQTEDGGDVVCLRQELSSDTQSLLACEQLMGSSFSVGDLLKVTAVSAALIVLCSVLAAVLFAGLKKKSRARAKTAVTVCFVTVSVLLAAQAVFFSTALPNIRMIPAALAALGCLFFAVSALRYRSGKAACLALVLALCAFAGYLLTFPWEEPALNAAVLAALVLAGIAATVIAAKRSSAKSAEISA